MSPNPTVRAKLQWFATEFHEDVTRATALRGQALRAWIEDVVVDAAARGHGAGLGLVEAAVEHAKAIGSKSVDLTSRPAREAANRLYKRAGFVLRETNVYRYQG